MFSLTREIQKKTEEQLSESLVCISLVSIFSFATLKEQCHEDFAVLAQFCAKIITLRV